MLKKNWKDSFVPLAYQNFSISFLKNLVDMNKVKINLDLILETSNECNSFRFDWIRFIDSYQFSSGSLDTIAKKS